MNKNEIIFCIIVIIAYLIFALTFDVPLLIHVVVGILLFAVLAITLLLKYKSEYENEKISRIISISSIVMLILYVITTISELWYNKTLIVDSGIFLFLFMILLVMGWFFKKSND